ncbi:MAG: hypothetical protein WB471_04955, partial [Nocardioides sp.]
SRATRPLLATHLRHTALAARLCRSGSVLDVGLRASRQQQEVFDDLVELGLARGRITTRMVRGLAAAGTRELADRTIPRWGSFRQTRRTAPQPDPTTLFSPSTQET